jgi:hypothetical protein
MFVLVTDDPTWHSKPDLRHPRPATVDPVSMVWVDPEELQEDEGDDADTLQRESSHLNMRVFGPFETYEEGQLTAAMLATDVDYWVVAVDQMGMVKPQP